jgi:HD-like signal output (HDOD) protein
MPSARQNKIDALLQQADRLHSAPTIALKIVEITRDPDFEIREVVTCLEHDPPLAGSILRLVNSSHFGLAHQVSSVQQAVAYLGRRALRLAVISFGMVKNLTSNAPGQLYGLYWKRSLTMACAARLCAQHIEADADEAFTGGLLADLGMLVLAQVHAEEYVRVAIDNADSDKLVESEQEYFGFDHAAVTARLLEQWQLPDELIEATASHHRWQRSGPPLTLLIYLSHLFSEILWTPMSPHMQAFQSLLAEQFDCDIDTLVDLALGCQQAVRESAEIFQVQLSGEIDIDAVQREARRQFESAALEATLDLDSLEAIFEDHSTGPRH